MDWKTLLTEVELAYHDAINPEQPIAKAAYLAMLSAFGELVNSGPIPEKLDTDLRRNLPGGGLSWPEVHPLSERIRDAITYANDHHLYPPAGQGIASNLRAILELTPRAMADKVLTPLQGTFDDIQKGIL